MAEMMITEEEKELFHTIRVKLGSPIRKVELDNSSLCTLLSYSIGDYVEQVHNFIIEGQWANMYGKNLTSVDLTHALSVRSLDMSKDYSHWFSKQVGLQQTGSKYELKKDFITIEPGVQSYVVPAGREINKVLHIAPPETNIALFAGLGGMGFGMDIGGTIASTGGVMGMSGSMGYGAGVWALPMADVALYSMSLSTKREYFQGALTYKVTAGPEGTHIIHLYGNDRYNFTGGGRGINMGGCTLWYTYYSVGDGSAEECRLLNPDVIISPDQVPLRSLPFGLLNDATKHTVRQLLYAHACMTLAMIRGKFSGSINMISSNLSLDYGLLREEGQRERDRVLTQLKERLERLNPYNQIAKQAEMVNHMKQINASIPRGIMVI